MTFLRRRHHNSPRPAAKSAPAFLQWIRGHECPLLAKGGCGGKIEAAHVDYAGDKGTATKVSDRYSVPMCQRPHREQHQMGWRTFEAKYLFSGLELALALWRRWPGRFKWEAKQALAQVGESL